MGRKYLLLVIIPLFALSSCGLFGKKLDSYKEDLKKDITKKVMEEAGFDNKEKREQLKKTGTKANAIITKVEDTNETINKNPKIKITLKVKPEGGEEFTAVITSIVSRVNIPRKGDDCVVYYDPNNKTDIIIE
jgi:hypothetical protein